MPPDQRYPGGQFMPCISDPEPGSEHLASGRRAVDPKPGVARLHRCLFYRPPALPESRAAAFWLWQKK